MEPINVQSIKRRKKVSLGYTLKSLRDNILKLSASELLTNEEVMRLDEIQRKAVERWSIREFH